MPDFELKIKDGEGHQLIESDGDLSQGRKTAAGYVLPFHGAMRQPHVALDMPVRMEGEDGEDVEDAADLSDFPNALVQQAWQEAWAKLGDGHSPEHTQFVWKFLKARRSRMPQPSRATPDKNAAAAAPRKVLRPPARPAAQPAVKQAARPAAPPVPAIRLSELFQIEGLAVRAGKPNKRVNFNFGPLGQQTGRYHYVLRDRPYVTLVFDRRFDLMDPYLPPQLSPHERIHLTITEEGGEISHDYVVGGTYGVINFGTWCLIPLVVVEEGRRQTMTEADEELPPGQPFV